MRQAPQACVHSSTGKPAPPSLSALIVPSHMRTPFANLMRLCRALGQAHARARAILLCGPIAGNGTAYAYHDRVAVRNKPFYSLLSADTGYVQALRSKRSCTRDRGGMLRSTHRGLSRSLRASLAEPRSSTSLSAV